MKQWGWWFGAVMLWVYVAASAAVTWAGALPHFTTLDQVIGALAAIAATIAAIYGALSYNAIQEQLKLALRELNAVEQDLKYSKEQSRLVQEQMEELQRRPNVAVCFEDGSEVITRPLPRSTENPAFYVAFLNNGNRTAKNIVGELYVPSEIAASRGWHSTIDGIAYSRIEFTLETLWPTGVPTVLRSVVVQVQRIPGIYTLYWRAFDDYGQYPRSKSHAPLSLKILG